MGFYRTRSPYNQHDNGADLGCIFNLSSRRLFIGRYTQSNAKDLVEEFYLGHTKRLGADIFPSGLNQQYELITRFKGVQGDFYSCGKLAILNLLLPTS
ncbi:uncharacterized protein LOC111803122 isoform X2 [Cucurbita pepo subsp. pepo]|uniref:uncharacterized protein LOC111803122 isoform X2 n=1 Tax=Cucurbita pepo subsp. pepo TaxID=3664 RepID=UPI000C9D3F33|nr:uncharacterized protein LOC111803122 isoform X2 [Cucurbita pepo subsp. pepo]